MFCDFGSIPLTFNGVFWLRELATFILLTEAAEKQVKSSRWNDVWNRLTKAIIKVVDVWQINQIKALVFVMTERVVYWSSFWSCLIIKLIRLSYQIIEVIKLSTCWTIRSRHEVMRYTRLVYRIRCRGTVMQVTPDSINVITKSCCSWYGSG